MPPTLSPSTPLCSLIRSAVFALPVAVSVTACDGVDEDSEVAVELALDDEDTAYSISPQADEAEDGGEVGELPAQLKMADGPIYPLVGNSWLRGGRASTDDEGGLLMGSSSDRSCFLSGLAGDLNHGQQPGFGGGVLSRPSVGHVRDPWDVSGDDYYLTAHGGAIQNQTNQQEWQGNVVRAQATCFFTTVNQWESYWDGGGPKKLAELGDNLLYARQCFLTGIVGVDGTYNSSRYARVVKRTLIDATHPTTGWYIESNLPVDPVHGSRPAVHAGCIDFPANTVFSSDSLSADPGETNSAIITWGTGIKACALTGIVGAFNVNSSSDGVLMTHPQEIDGDWTVEVNNGKTAAWTCAK